jgi:hypothetical protein
MTLGELRQRLSSLCTHFRTYDARIDGAKLCADLLRHLDELGLMEASRWVPLDEAADRTGYSAGHLRKLAKKGSVPAEKRGGRLYLDLETLPRRPKAAVARNVKSYDPQQDARRIAARRSQGGTSHE